jgi:Cu/Ag efflux protein CusF
MKKYVLAISVVLCTVMLGMAIAQEKATEQQKPEKAPQVEAKAQTGEVTSIDATKNEIVIKDDAGAEVRLLISTSTKITKAGKTIALGDIKVGDKVASECVASADGCQAKSLTVIPAPSK